jgi:predicted enzyme related to lactoylglutathione lyase
MSRVVHFEIHAENPERAVSFYKDLFGWTFTKWDGPMEYWMILTASEHGRTTGDKPAEGINGGLVRRRGPAPMPGQAVNAYCCTVDVANLDASLTKAQSLSATIAVPKMAIPGVGWLAYIIDTEGNILGMMQNDPAAK